MKTRNTEYRSSRTAAAPAFSKGRRNLLFLGMALAGTGSIGDILHLPLRIPGQASRGHGLSRHEAVFYSTHGTGD
jgi:hypothetical protein